MALVSVTASLCLLLPSDTCSAGGLDGGTDSPFAAGAGARALALGGAYTAVAEGPSALVWNPAGLALEQRKTASFYYSSPFLEGSRYTFVGYTHPLLDLGTLGFGNLRYGVGEIDKYGSDGAPLGSFSNVQNEWLLSYAPPPFGPASFGANLKVETHELDDKSATAVGADLGVLIRSEERSRHALARQNFGLGISIRNILEPRLTLSEEEQSLPLLVRSGVSYSLPLGSSLSRRVLLLASFEQGVESGGRSRFGAEFDVDPTVALRVGAGPEEWSTGVGFALSGGTIDYTFASHEIGSTHRVELTLAFGTGLHDLRLARQREEEEHLAKRTEEELLQKERNQIETNLAQGRRHFKKKAYTQAEAWFERALLWDSENSEALSMLSQCRCERHLDAAYARAENGDLLDAIESCNEALAALPGDSRATNLLGELRTRLELSSARSREVSEFLAKGIEYLTVGNFSGATNSFMGVLEVDEGNPEATRYLARTDSLAGAQVLALVEEADWFRKRGDLKGARERIRRAMSIQPENLKLRNTLARLDQASSRTEASAKVESAREQALPQRTLSSAEAGEAERMYQSGVEEFRNRRHSESIPYFEFVFALQPAYENVTPYLKQVYLFVGMEQFTAGNLVQAVNLWEKILDIDPNDEKALSYVRRAWIAIRKTRELAVSSETSTGG